MKQARKDNARRYRIMKRETEAEWRARTEAASPPVSHPGLAAVNRHCLRPSMLIASLVVIVVSTPAGMGPVSAACPLARMSHMAHTLASLACVPQHAMQEKKKIQEKINKPKAERKQKGFLY